MAFTMNRVQLVGNITKDPVVREMPNGNDKCANFSVAVTEKWKSKDGEQKERTDFINCVAWGWYADTAAKLAKGQAVYVEGRFSTRKWQNKEGQDQYTTEVVIQGMQAMLQAIQKTGGGASTSASRESAPPQSRTNGASSGGHQKTLDDEIPFSWIIVGGLGLIVAVLSAGGLA